MNKWLMLALLPSSLLIGCSTSQAPGINYFVLQPAEHNSANLTTNNALIRQSDFVIEEVTVASYLQKNQLPLLVNAHQVYYSTQNLWAEPINQGLKRALDVSLQHLIPAKAAVESNIDNQTNPVSVTVHFDDFIANHEANVVANGYFWLNLKDGHSETLEYRFSLQLPLQKDGFEHAISQQRKLVDTLAQNIAQAAKDAQTK